MMKNKTLAIQSYILSHVEKHHSDIASLVCRRFHVTRMTAIRHLQALIRQQKIIKSGKTFGTKYYLRDAKNKIITIKIENTLDEFAVFKKYLDKELSLLPKNQYQLYEYCCTELINNAKDHSRGTKLHIATKWSEEGLTVEFEDNGIGIFRNLQQSLNLPDMQTGLLALSKGKITTDPKNHTGEGIFFSSRMVDRFVMEANNICYTKDNKEDDWTYRYTTFNKGTKIILFVAYDCNRNIQDVFLAYTRKDDYQFDKTEILVELAKLGDERYISRSQAKRILMNLEKFSHIVLDFRNVETVGQGFVDEVFRVFQNQFPQIKITYRHANDNVEFMIKRSV